MADIILGTSFGLVIEDEISRLDDAIHDLVEYCENLIIMAPTPSHILFDCGFVSYSEPRVKDWEQRRYRRQGKPRRKR